MKIKNGIIKKSMGTGKQCLFIPEWTGYLYRKLSLTCAGRETLQGEKHAKILQNGTILQFLWNSRSETNIRNYFFQF